MNYESLIFDVDGTLWDCRVLLADAYNAQLKAEGMEPYITMEILNPVLGKTMTVTADGLFPQVAAPERYALMDRCIVRLNAHLEKYASPAIGYDALRSTMETLSKSHRLFIVSNGPKGYAQLAGKSLGLADLITGYLSWGDTLKPKGQTIAQLMKEHNIESAVYIGDTQGDLEACVEAGIPFVWASYGFGAPERYDYKIDSFAQLTGL